MIPYMVVATFAEDAEVSSDMPTLLPISNLNEELRVDYSSKYPLESRDNFPRDTFSPLTHY